MSPQSKQQGGYTSSSRPRDRIWSEISAKDYSTGIYTEILVKDGSTYLIIISYIILYTDTHNLCNVVTKSMLNIVTTLIKMVPRVFFG